MTLGEKIYKLRKNEKLSQEDFAAIFGVSRQAVQKWENGSATPEISKIAEISKRFGVSLDALVLDRERREVEEMGCGHIKPFYEDMPDWEFYASAISDEYTQCIDEGLDVARYKDIFDAVARLEKSEIKKDFGDVIYKIVRSAGPRADYAYNEPAQLEEIKALRRGESVSGEYDRNGIADKIHGGWLGRICGCMLGKPVEGVRRSELEPFLKDTGNFPMKRYILRADLSEEILKKYKFSFAPRIFADEADGMPVDDDTNYIVLAQVLIERFGRDFSPRDVAECWTEYQPKSAYCTAERVAFCNFVNGYMPPVSAVYKNPYREWIGAQIRGDYFGYINPGNPEEAAEMAWRDASISHVKNGIYGEMFVSAMIASAALTENMREIIESGLAQIPHTSRLHEAVSEILKMHADGRTQKETFDFIHERYDEHTGYGWTHTVPNAMIVAAALLYGDGDYTKSICMAVQTGFDTDCNGATVGSVLGMAKGTAGIPDEWSKPLRDTLHTSIFGVGDVKISERAEMTVKHLEK